MRSYKTNYKAIITFLLITLSENITAEQTVGLFVNEPESYNGYTLFAPTGATTTYLIDNKGELVHSWESNYVPGQSVYLLEDGNLLRTISYSISNQLFNAGGAGGGVQILNWEGDVIWEYICSDSTQRQHHDAEYIPNGNILLVVWELKDSSECIAAGREPSLLNDGELWPDKIIEVKPIGTNDAEIVWEWHIWNHIIQDYNSSLPNFGNIEDHPELLDINCVAIPEADWNHTNSVDYNSELDQIIISLHSMNEFFIIDHSTTSEEAAGHSGGNSGMGGDILFRWGKPKNYNASGEQQLYLQHDVHWIPEGYPGAGNILIFNNGNPMKRPYSSICEIITPIQENKTYDYSKSPLTPTWSYEASTATDFYAKNISGAQRLLNGNTLICDGPAGRFFEVTSNGETVWEYINPVTKSGIVSQGEEIPTTPDGSTMNTTFRCYRYALNYTGLIGKDLTPKGTIESGNTTSISTLNSKALQTITIQNNQLNLNKHMAKVKITSLNGRFVINKENTSGIVNLSSLSNGIYFANISIEGKTFTQKISIIK